MILWALCGAIRAVSARDVARFVTIWFSSAWSAETPRNESYDALPLAESRLSVVSDTELPMERASCFDVSGEYRLLP